MVLLLFVSLIVLMLLGIPVAFAVGLSSLLYLILDGVNLSMVAQSIVRGINSFTMLAIPFFFMAGELMNSSGITDKIIRMANVLVGHMKGGLAQVNIVASMFFAGISGSATADTVALGSVLIPAMEKEGYDVDFAAAVTAASSIVGPIIPPSITMVIYGIVTQVPVGPLLLAGLLPGILLGITQIIYVYFYSIKMNYPSRPRADFKEARSAVFSGTTALLMPIIIVGGVLSGAFTATESAAIAVLYGMFIGVVVYRRINLGDLFRMSSKVAIASSNTLLILANATIFSWVLTKARVPETAIRIISGFTDSSVIIMLLFIVLLFVAGMFMIPSQALIVIAPILTPVAMSYGIDPIHFGVVVVLTLTLGGATPPVGILLYTCADIAQISFERMVKAILPFYLPIIIAILLIAFIPSISLFIPSLSF